MVLWPNFHCYLDEIPVKIHQNFGENFSIFFTRESRAQFGARRLRNVASVIISHEQTQ